MKKIVPTFDEFINESKKLDVTSFPDTKESSKKLKKMKPSSADEADWFDAVQSVTISFTKTASLIDVAEKYNDNI